MRRNWAALAAVLSLSTLALGASGPPTVDDVNASIKKFTKVFDAVESNFADPVDSDRAIYKGAIPGMLRTLDPHSNFFDPQAYQLLREDQTGHYFGVGMMIGAPEGIVVVMYPFRGSPAFRAGIHPGDVILAVNDKDAEKLDVGGVSAMLKGPRGTPAQIKVEREGNKEPLWFNVVRDEVPRNSVPHAFWLKPGIGYLRVESFNENTSKEAEQALARLDETAMQGLILDLRDNPGGILQEAVAVADHFLHKGQLIVSHHGRASQETKFVAKRGGYGREYPIVVLVNRGSASAAEILAGALQDHDRAWILGENTFGKGLVQAPYSLSGDSALLLTIAHYYTPSGRLIQRDYEHQSFYAYYSRNAGKNDLHDMKKTDSGRVVYGGDGISPDQKFVYPNLTRLEAELAGNLTFFFYAPEFFAGHKEPLQKTWQADPATMKSFEEFAEKRGLHFTASEFKADERWIQERLREQLLVTSLSKEDSEQVAFENDPEVQKALESLASSKALLAKGKPTVASGVRGTALTE